MSNYEDLIKGMIHKDEKSYQEFYDMTNKMAYSMALQMLKKEEDAFDVLQDAYIKAYNKIDTVDNPERLVSWFNMIVANTCRDYMKKKKPVLFNEMDTEEFEFQDTLENENQEFVPEAAADYKETKRLMKEILDSLSPEQKMCTLMFYYEDLSVKEIAEALECSENTVKSRLNYARKKIKEDVLALEKKGTKLYGIAPIPFIIWMLKQQEILLQVPKAIGAASAGASAAATTAATEAAGHSAFEGIVGAVTKLFSKKVIATTVAATLAVGGGVGGKALYDKHQEEQELLRQAAAEDAILAEMDEEFLEGVFYYAPLFDEDNPVNEEEMGTLVHYSMLYKYIYYFGDEQRMTMLADDDVIECIHSEESDDTYDNHITVSANAFDQVAQKLRFTTPIDADFVANMDAGAESMKWEGDEITLGTTGLGGFPTDWDVSIDAVTRDAGKICVGYTLTAIDYIENAEQHSYREAVLVTGEQGYEIESITEREGSTGAQTIAEN